MSDAPVLYEQRDHVVTITYNRPHRKNAINGDMREGLNEAWLRFRDDEDAWVAIMTGAGDAFSAGQDLGPPTGLPCQVEALEGLLQGQIALLQPLHHAVELAEHAAARGHRRSLLVRGPGVENVGVGDLRGGVQPGQDVQAHLSEAVRYQLPQLTPFAADQLLYACGESADSPADGPLSVRLDREQMRPGLLIVAGKRNELVHERPPSGELLGSFDQIVELIREPASHDAACRILFLGLLGLFETLGLRRLRRGTFLLLRDQLRH